MRGKLEVLLAKQIEIICAIQPVRKGLKIAPEACATSYTSAHSYKNFPQVVINRTQDVPQDHPSHATYRERGAALSEDVQNSPVQIDYRAGGA